MSARAAEIIHMSSRLTCRDRQLAAALRGAEAPREPSTLPRALVESVACLARAGVGHALIGGLAVAVRTGEPRGAEGGFALHGRFAHSVNLVHAQGEPLQLAFDAGFDAAIDRAETCSVAGTPIRIVRREDLIALKERAAADPRRRRSKALRDRSDVEMLRGDVPGPDEGW
ncbi:MAG TPA: hypothetical protein VFY71_09505 [Planctomycetota bacterium]|nr:hypothetical protein [Planctomycetota bacterium]